MRFVIFLAFSLIYFGFSEGSRDDEDYINSLTNFTDLYSTLKDFRNSQLSSIETSMEQMNVSIKNISSLCLDKFLEIKKKLPAPGPDNTDCEIRNRKQYDKALDYFDSKVEIYYRNITDYVTGELKMMKNRCNSEFTRLDLLLFKARDFCEVADCVQQQISAADFDKTQEKLKGDFDNLMGLIDDNTPSDTSMFEDQFEAYINKVLADRKNC